MTSANLLVEPTRAISVGVRFVVEGSQVVEINQRIPVAVAQPLAFEAVGRLEELAGGGQLVAGVRFYSSGGN